MLPTAHVHTLTHCCGRILLIICALFVVLFVLFVLCFRSIICSDVTIVLMLMPYLLSMLTCL